MSERQGCAHPGCEAAAQSGAPGRLAPLFCAAHASSYPDPTWRVLMEVADERGRQRAKWGVQEAPPAVWLAIIGEEFGEACVEALAMRGGHRPDGVLDPAARERFRAELVQLAAVAVQTVEALDRAAAVTP